MEPFETPRTIYKLEFEGDQFDGLVVRVKALTFEELRDNRDVLGKALGPQDSMEEAENHIQKLHQLFVDHLVEWNLTKDGEPVPLTLAGLHSQESVFIGRLVGAWRNNTLGVSAPFVPPSNDGDQSVALSIPMETPLVSLAS